MPERRRRGGGGVLEPGQAVAAGQELALARAQGQALARVQEPRSVLDLMHP